MTSKTYTQLHLKINPIESNLYQKIKMNNWPHAPAHLLQEVGIYMVTCGTYLKVHHFRSEERRKMLHDALLANLREAGWTLHAWAVDYAKRLHCTHGVPQRILNCTQRTPS